MAQVGGIYEIIGPNGRLYIGSTKDLRIRLKSHKLALIRGDHTSIEMQNDWNEYGEEAFTFKPVVLVADADRRLYLEQCILTKLFEAHNLYNTSSTVGYYKSTGARKRTKPRLIIRKRTRTNPITEVL